MEYHRVMETSLNTALLTVWWGVMLSQGDGVWCAWYKGVELSQGVWCHRVIEIHHRVMSHPITPYRHPSSHPYKTNSLSFKSRGFCWVNDPVSYLPPGRLSADLRPHELPSAAVPPGLSQLPLAPILEPPLLPILEPPLLPLELSLTICWGVVKRPLCYFQT